MGLAIRHLIATESGRLVRVPAARWHRAYAGTDRLLEYAGQELKVLDVIVELERKRALRVVWVLPHRTTVGVGGHLKTEGAEARAINRLSFGQTRQLTPDDVIARLQEDASYFWEPPKSQWNQAADLLGVKAADLEGRWHLPPG